LETQFRSQRVLTTDEFDESVAEAIRDSGASLEAVERMTLEEIGSLLGLKLETVSRILSRFQAEKK